MALLISLLITLLIIVLIVYVIQKYLPLDAMIKNILIAIVVLMGILSLLRYLPVGPLY